MLILSGVGADMIEVDRDTAGRGIVRVTGRKEEYPPEWNSELRN